MLIEPCIFWTKKIGVWSTPCPIVGPVPPCNVYDFSQGLVTYRDNEWPSANTGGNGVLDDSTSSVITSLSEDGVWSMSQYSIAGSGYENQFVYDRTFVFRKRVGDLFIYQFEFNVEDPTPEELFDTWFRGFISGDGNKVLIIEEVPLGNAVEERNLIVRSYLNTGTSLTYVGESLLTGASLPDINNILPGSYATCTFTGNQYSVLNTVTTAASMDSLYIAVRCDDSGDQNIGYDVFKYSINWNTGALVLVKYIEMYGPNNWGIIMDIDISANGEYIAMLTQQQLA